jgi:hypothetical protein
VEAANEPAVVWDVDLVFVPQNLAHLSNVSPKIIFCCNELRSVRVHA